MAKFVYGANYTFKNGDKYAHDWMGMTDSISEAAKLNAELHPSFGCSIYEVDETQVAKDLRVSFGFRIGKRCHGVKVIRLVGAAYSLLPEGQWEELVALWRVHHVVFSRAERDEGAGFWSDDIGWTPLESATVYAVKDEWEQRRMRLPMSRDNDAILVSLGFAQRYIKQ